MTKCDVCRFEMPNPIPDDAIVFTKPDCPDCGDVDNPVPKERPDGSWGFPVHVAHPECFDLKYGEAG